MSGSMLGTSGASLPKWPHLESGNEAPPNKSVGCTVSTSSSESRRKGQLTYHPPLFHDFWHFNVKAAAVHHPVIQKEVDELLAKGAIEPSSSGAGFYSSMFMVPNHTGGLHPILNLKHFNCYMHIPSFKMLTL